jgi:hypothetical protein
VIASTLTRILSAATKLLFRNNYFYGTDKLRRVSLAAGTGLFTLQNKAR